mmetsp:Transcript_126597/g.219455  ORF Transcript_126597/g.219455 Transcript_126597/m.219455 type:complete len:428 (+) Transcript_126597:123-1406(+)
MTAVRWCALVASLPLTLVVGKAYFSEDFDGEAWKKKWVFSRWRKQDHTHGNWSVKNEGTFPHKNYGLFTMQADIPQFYTAVAPIEPFTNEGKDLVVQFSVQRTRDTVCADMYMTLGPPLRNPKRFGRHSPYYIKFGPHKCGGYDAKTLLEFTYKNKTRGKKHHIGWVQVNEKPYIYRFILRPGPPPEVEVQVNGRQQFIGPYKENWELLEPENIDDKEDVKPADWIDDDIMDDTRDRKPRNWVDVKRVPDPELEKPPGWDDDEDGEWKPLKPNPEYLGEWRPKKIQNPNYKGQWKPKTMPNPEFYDDDAVYVHDEIGYVGFNLFQQRGGVFFDNIYIGDSEDEAEDMLKEYWEWIQQRIDHAERRNRRQPNEEEIWNDHTPVDFERDDDEEVPLFWRELERQKAKHKDKRAHERAVEHSKRTKGIEL